MPYQSNPLTPLTKHPRKTRLLSDAFYSFSKYYRGLTASVNHFQLRYSIAMVSKYDLIHLEENGFYKFSTLDHDIKHFTFKDGFKPVSLNYAHGYVAMTGMHGQLVIYDLQAEKTRHFETTTLSNDILNHIAMFKNGGDLNLLTGANDSYIRAYKMEYLSKPYYLHKLDSAVNNCSVRPLDGNLIAVCSDQNEVELLDLRANKIVARLYGHEDFSFTSEWHPNGLFLATGNQRSDLQSVGYKKI